MAPNCCEPLPRIFCTKCQMSLDEPCWTHATRFSDKYVVPYAVASLPEQLYLNVSSAEESDKSVFAKEFLPSHSVFGPLVAPFSENGTGFRYVIRSELDRKLRCFQLESDLLSNWMKYVRFAREPSEQNVVVYSVGAQIFFVTTVDIFPGEELKVGYSVKYYTKLMHISSTESNPREPDRNDPTVSADIPSLTDQKAREASSSEPHTKTFVVNNWQISCVMPVPDVCQVTRDSTEGQKSPECGRKKRPHPSFLKETELVQSVEEAQSLQSVKRKRQRGMPASTREYTEALPGEKRRPCFFCGRMIIKMGIHIKTVHPELACSDCNKDFSTVKELLSHTAESAQEEAINFMKRTGFVQHRCTKCLSVFSSKLLLDLHDYHHTGTTDFTHVPPQCPGCEFIGTTISDLLQHVSSHVLGKRQKSACLLCGYSTRSMWGHLRIAHSVEMQIITEKWRFECLECQDKYLRKSALHRHIDGVHKGYLCLCCGARVIGRIAFDQHVTDHKVDGSFRCRLCGRSCAEYPDLHEHFGQEHREDVRVQCHLCRMVFLTAKGLATHIKKRHNLDECRQDNEAMQADNRLPASDMYTEDTGTLPETDQFILSCAPLVPVSLDEPGTDADVSLNESAMDEEEAGNAGSSLPATASKPKRKHKPKHAKTSYKRKCMLCDGKFYDREQHMQDAHPDCQDPNPFACTHCSQKFSSEASLRHHARHQAHPLPTKAIPAAALEEAIEHIKTTGTFSYYCWKCRVHYPTKTLLLLHEFMHVTDGMEEQ